MDTSSNKGADKMLALPPLKVQSISPTKRFNYPIISKQSNILKSSSHSLNDLSSNEMTKSSSIHNRKLLIKLNSIKFINGIIYNGKNNRDDLNKIEKSSRNDMLDSSTVFPSFYTTSYNLVKNLELNRFNSIKNQESFNSVEFEKSILLPNINNSETFRPNSDNKTVDININFKNKYELISILKQDGMFSVQTSLICLKTNIKQKYLMKKLDLTESTSTNGITKKQIEEYENLLNNNNYISNLNLTKIKETFLSKDLKSFYIVSEYCNESFEHILKLHYLKREFVQFNSVLSWFMQTLSAISFLHSNCNLMHANLKPSNFLIQNNVIKLADFGYLSIKSRFKYLLKLVNNPVNRLYLPMETFRNYKYSLKSDIFTVGSIFYELLLLENYHFLKESLKDKIRLRVDDKNEKFSYSLTSMLSNTESDRPSADELKTYFEFDNTFEFIKKLSSGSFSQSVLIRFKIETIKESKRFLFKQIDLNLANKPSVFEALQQTVVSDTQTHENLLFINKYFLVGSRLMILRDYLEDCINLRQKLEITKLDENTLLNKWITQIISGLEYLHSKSIIHGNLKCENILFNQRDIIKLTDFGVYHLIDLEDENSCISEYSDIYALGCIMYLCVTTKDLNFDDEFVKILEPCNYTENTKNTILSMVNIDPQKRPDLKNLLTTLINLNYSRVQNNSFVSLDLDGRTKTFLANDKDFILINVFKKKQPREHCIYSCLRIKAKRGNNQLVTEKLSFNTGPHKVSQDTIGCNCPNKSFHTNKGYVTELPNSLPKICCLISNNYLVGCNSDFIYLIDDQLKYIKSMCLIEILEMRHQSNVNSNAHTHTNNNSNAKLEPIRKNYTHSSLINRFNLKLEVVCICYDSKTQKLYIMMTVHNQYCLLNIFNMELSIKTKLSISISENLHLLAPRQHFINVVTFNLFLENTFHIPILNSVITSKSMCCTDKYLFISERNFLVRAFSKDTAKYLFTLTQSATLIEPPVLGNSNRTFETPFTIALSNNQLDSKVNLLDEFHDSIQDICVDNKGNLYVAYCYTIKVYDPNCSFLWRHDFSKRVVNGKIINIAINKLGHMAIITQDEKNENLNKIYVFL